MKKKPNNRLPVLRTTRTSALLGLSFLGAASLQGVTPVEYTDGMKNPLMGYKEGQQSYGARSGLNAHLIDQAGDKLREIAQLPYSLMVRDYIAFNVFDNGDVNSVNDVVLKIKNYSDIAYKGYAEKNIKVIPRVILTYSHPTNYWPQDMNSNDWTSLEIQQRVERVVRAMGLAWNNDPRIAWIQMGIVGNWGEQEGFEGTPSGFGLDTPLVGGKTWKQILGKEFKDAFTNKMVAVRSPHKWNSDFPVGMYWDTMCADNKMNTPGLNPWTGQYDEWPQLKRNNQASPIGRLTYHTAPVEGEIIYPGFVLSAQMGSDEDATYPNTQYTQFLVDTIKSSHITASGVGYGDTDSATDKIVNWNANKAGIAKTQAAFGYRFVINDFTCTGQILGDKKLSFNATVTNGGSAPTYAKGWPLHVVMMDSSKNIVWTSPVVTDSSGNPVDITKWLPGTNYDWTYSKGGFGSGTKKYLTPALPNQISGQFTVPDSIGSGQYTVGLSILDPTTSKPGIYFSVNNFYEASNTQPLARVGVGVPPSTSAISFDAYNWFTDDRYYGASGPSGTTYTLTESSPNGSVTFSPAGPTYAAGTVVTVTSNPSANYTFTGWSGDLSGTTNPTTITMNGNKSITANTAPSGGGGTTYTLTETSPNGSVTFSPAGPTYAAGTVVTVTSNPASGFVFSSWGGDLSGTTNPTTITMNSNKAIVANTTTSGGTTYTLTETSPNGSVTFNPAGPTYAAGTVVTVTSNPAPGFVFSSWGGNLSGTSNPTTITMNSNKAIVANTTTSGGGTFTLTETSPNGTVTFSPAGPTYPSGTVVTVTSNPASGYMFTGWGGDLSGSVNPTTITMNSNKSIVANTSTTAWLTLDVGAVGATGSAVQSGSTWTIRGSGADIWGAADEFRYVYQATTADCSITARVADLTNTNEWAKAGVMIRETTDANAQCAMVCVTPSRGVSFQWRTATGGSTLNTATVQTLTAPKWLRLTRTGNTFAASYLDDSNVWRSVGTSQLIDMRSASTFGMAVTSKNDGVLCTSTFDNVTAAP